MEILNEVVEPTPRKNPTPENDECSTFKNDKFDITQNSVSDTKTLSFDAKENSKYTSSKNTELSQVKISNLN